MNKINLPALITGGLVSITACTGLAFTSIKAYANNDSVTDNISITVPVSCTMSGNIATGQEHTAILYPGTYSGASDNEYENGIGKTTLTTFCNDNNGFSIYAIGFTDDTEGNNTLLGTNTGLTIATKVYESTDTTSNWSMKVTKVNDSTQTFNPANMSIKNSFDTWHTIPDDYIKVAEYHASAGSSATDRSLGAKVETTYASYISTTQPADTYTGKVKYVMIHPYDHVAPEIEIPGVYTISRADGVESSTQIGQAIPNNTAIYDSPAEAINAWEEIWNQKKTPFYLKHTIINGIITESYVGFTIAPELAAENEGLIPGNYALRGGIDESSSQDKPIFTANADLLKTVYDYANHPDRCQIEDDFISCSAENFVSTTDADYNPTPYASVDGSVCAGFSLHCNVYGSGYSSCEWQ